MKELEQFVLGEQQKEIFDKGNDLEKYNLTIQKVVKNNL